MSDSHLNQSPVAEAPLTPLRFQPIYKSVVWGGDIIAKYKGVEIDRENVGESWEVSAIAGQETPVSEGPLKGQTLAGLVDTYGARLIGTRLYERGVREFPLLIKFIDAHSDLSLQVHPGEEIARYRHNCSGKTEMWYVIDTIPDATIISGFTRQITRNEYRSKVADGTILDSVAVHPSRPGDVFFIPSGRVHAIGAGNLLLEVQQSSDITYRIYDYGRGRELHTHLAADAIDYRVHSNYKLRPRRVRRGVQVLVQCPMFEVKHLKVNGTMTVTPPDNCFITLTCIEGEASVITRAGVETITRGHTLLIPAEIADDITLRGKARIVTASC